MPFMLKNFAFALPLALLLSVLPVVPANETGISVTRVRALYEKFR